MCGLFHMSTSAKLGGGEGERGVAITLNVSVYQTLYLFQPKQSHVLAVPLIVLQLCMIQFHSCSISEQMAWKMVPYCWNGDWNMMVDTR